MGLDKKLIYISMFSLFWSLLIFLNKVALNSGVKEVPYTIQTTIVSCSLLVIYNILTKRKEFKKVKLEHLKILFFIGIFVGTAYILSIYGLRLSTSINYGFLIKSSIVFTLLLAYVFLKEKMDKIKVILMIVFIIGVYLVTTKGKMIVPKIGDLLILATAFCFSTALIIQKPLTAKIHPDIVSLGRVFFALLVILSLIPIMKLNILEIIGLKYVLISGLFAANVTIFLSKTISVSSASYLTMMSMMVPVIVAILGVIFLKEHMNIFQIVGGLMIIVSGILTQKKNI